MTSWLEKPDGTERTWRPLVFDGISGDACLILRLEDKGTEALELWDREVLRGRSVFDAQDPAREVSLLTRNLHSLC